MVLEALKDKVKGWLLGVALKKAVKRLAQLAASYAAGWQLAQYGYTGSEVEITAGIYAISDVVRNYLKVKLGWKFL